MNTYIKSMQYADGLAFARQIRTHLQQGDKLVKLEIDQAKAVAVGTFEEAREGGDEDEEGGDE